MGADLDLGTIPGPLALSRAGATLWIAGGGRGHALIARLRGGRFLRSARTEAFGLRAVLALGETSAIVAGEYGYLARTDDDGATFHALAAGTRACLYDIACDEASGALLLAGDDGLRVSRDGGATFERHPGWTGRVVRVLPEHDLAIGEHILARLDGSPLFQDDRAVLNDVVVTDRGLLLVGDRGEAWRSDSGASWERCELGTTSDLERAVVVDGAFVVLAASGAIYTSPDGSAWEAATVLPGFRLTALATDPHGWIVTGWRQEGPPYRFAGALAFLGSSAHAPKAAPPCRRVVPNEADGSAASGPTAELFALLGDRRRWATDLSPDAVTALLDAGADLHARRPYGRTALAIAIERPHQKGDPILPLDVLEVLIAGGAELDAIDDHGQSIVELAARSSSDADAEDAAMALLERLVDGGARFPEERGAPFSDSAAQCALLLRAGARVDVADVGGDLPIHHAASRGKVDTLRFLLAHGVDPNVRDGLGRTPLRRARRTMREPWVAYNDYRHAFQEIIAMLEAAGGVEARAYAWDAADPSSPRPIDDAAVAAACAGLPDSFARLASRGSDSAQDLVATLRHHGDPDGALDLLEHLASTLDEPRELTIPGDFQTRRPFFWNGDLVVEGDVAFDHPSAITGSVRATGIVVDSGNDSCVTILGRLTCRGLLTDGDFAVRGDIEASEIVWGYYNDFVLSAATIRAPVVIEDDHATSADIDSPNHFDLDTFNEGDDEVRDALRELFIDEVFDAEARLDRHDVFRRLSEGAPVFRARGE